MRAAVPYKETIRRGTQQHSRFKRQIGGHGQFADITDRGQAACRAARALPLTTASSAARSRATTSRRSRKASRKRCSHGPLGFPVVDLSVNLITGQFHAVDSSDMAFKTAGRQAMQEALAKCEPFLLEPIDAVEISVPNAFTARVQRLVSGRRGQILGYDGKEDWPGWDVVQRPPAAKRAA